MLCATPGLQYVCTYCRAAQEKASMTNTPFFFVSVCHSVGDGQHSPPPPTTDLFIGICVYPPADGYQIIRVVLKASRFLWDPIAHINSPDVGGASDEIGAWKLLHIGFVVQV